MPLIKDLKNLTRNKNTFQKKDYRPWDDNVEVDTNIIKQNITEKIIKPLLDKPNSSLNLAKESLNFYGAKKVIMKFLLLNKAEEEDIFYITKLITSQEIESFCKIPTSTIKASIQDLKKRQLIYAYDKKPGRGGYARYSYTKEIYNFFIDKL